MKIYTSYFAKLSKIPENIIPISIALHPPYWYKGAQYRKLSPTDRILTDWKLAHNESSYISTFCRDVLDHLNPHKVVKELADISHGRDVALLCYERSDSFCHRHLVSEWLCKNGYTAMELTD